LAQASMKLGEAMYQASQGQAAGAAGPSAGAGGPDDKVVDVDFEEVKDDDSKKSA
jgi:molecular chaperone DnaK